MKKRCVSIMLALSMVLSLIGGIDVITYADDSEPYVVTDAVASGSSYVLACQDENIYHVVAIQDGNLVVIDTETLTQNVVEKIEAGGIDEETGAITAPASVLWTVSGVNAAFAICNSGLYLTAEYAYMDLTEEDASAWDYNAEEGYIDYTTWSDDIYLLSVSDGVVSAYGGDFNHASGKVVFYSLQSSETNDHLKPEGNLKANAAGEPSMQYIAVASDRHSNSSSIGNAMGGMPGNVEYVCLNGDMVNSGVYNSSTILSEVNNVFSESDSISVNIIYGYDHDAAVNDDAGIMFGKSAGDSGLMYTGYNDDKTPLFYVYGVAYYDMYSKSEETVSSAAQEFETWIDNSAEAGVPVIVICHMPLHYQRKDNGYAIAWNKALNYAATGEETTSSGEEIIRNVMFLHGHNHTSENNYEYYIPVGSTMQIFNEGNPSYIYYTYTTAGYLNANNTASLIGFDDSNITISKYQNGSVTSTYASAGAKTDFSNTYDTSATHTIERVAQADVKQYTVTFNSNGGTDVAAQTITAGETAAEPSVPAKNGFTFAGWYSDEALTEMYDFTAPVTDDITLYAKWEEIESLSYEYVSAAEAGKSYVVVSNGYALANSSGILSGVAVNLDGDTITINDGTVSESSILWTINSSGDMMNGGYYLLRAGAAGSKAATAKTTDPSDDHSNWTYTGEQLTLADSSSPAQIYYIYYSNGWYIDVSTSYTARLYGEAGSSAHEHSYGEPTYEWTETEGGYICTATAACSGCDDETEGHTITETVAATYAVTTAATFKKTGVGTYTATFTNEAFETQTITEVIPEVIFIVTTSDAINVTEALAAAGKTEAVIKAEIAESAAELDGYDSDNIWIGEIELLVSEDDGKTWRKATEDDFPITIVVPYPEKANDPSLYDYQVIHMFAEGSNAGQIEMVPSAETTDGLQITVTGMSPFGITWKKAKADEKPADNKPADNNPANSNSSNNKSAAGSSTSNSPKTGDSENMYLYLGIVMVCGLIIAGNVIILRRRRNHR